jgi:hypothetical protein
MLNRQNKFTISRISKKDCVSLTIVKSKGKNKIIPLQAWTGHECSRKLRLPDFKTIST